jgi:hypothetical protein
MRSKVWEVVSLFGGSLRITRIVPGNDYFLETIEGHKIVKAINGKYLKGYQPSEWQEA